MTIDQKIRTLLAPVLTVAVVLACGAWLLPADSTYAQWFAVGHWISGAALAVVAAPRGRPRRARSLSARP